MKCSWNATVIAGCVWYWTQYEHSQGPTLVGTFLNLILYGVFMTQVYLYFNMYKQDPTWLKTYIGGTVLFETLNSIFAMIYSYNRLVLNFGDGFAQSLPTWQLGICTGTNGIIGMAVQLFFAWRVRTLTGNLFAVVPIVVLALVSCGAALYLFIESVIATPSLVLNAQLRPLIISWLVCSSVADILISGILILYLNKHRTGIRGTDTLINKVIRLTIQTGAITCLCSLLDLSFYLGISGAAIHLIFNQSLAKLYTNCLMSSLNSRGEWKSHWNSTNISHRHRHSRSRSGYRSSDSQFDVETGPGVSGFVTSSRGRSGEDGDERGLKGWGGRDRQIETVGQVGLGSLENALRPEVFINIETHELSDRDADHYLDETDHDPSLVSALESPYKYEDSVPIDRSTPGDGEQDGNVESGMDVRH